MLVPLFPSFKVVRTADGVYLAMMRFIIKIVIMIMIVVVVVIMTVVIMMIMIMIMVVTVSMVMVVVMAQEKRHQKVHTHPAGSCDEHEAAVDRIGVVCQSGYLYSCPVRSHINYGDTAACTYLWTASYTKMPVIIQINCMDTNAPRISIR